MTFQKRLKAAMRRRNMRVADIARHFNRPYTTVREWVLNGRIPDGTERDRRAVERILEALERG